jgi:hypothetical protein
MKDTLTGILMSKVSSNNFSALNFNTNPYRVQILNAHSSAFSSGFNFPTSDKFDRKILSRE